MARTGRLDSIQLSGGGVPKEAHPGWSRVYASVVAPGTVRVGDAVLLLPPAGH